MFLHDVSVVAAAADAVSKSVLLKLSLKSSWQFFRHEAHAAFLLLYENLMTFLSCHQWWLPGQARPDQEQARPGPGLNSTRLDLPRAAVAVASSRTASQTADCQYLWLLSNPCTRVPVPFADFLILLPVVASPAPAAAPPPPAVVVVPAVLHVATAQRILN